MKTMKYFPALILLLGLLTALPLNAQDMDKAPKGERPHEMMMRDKPMPPFPPIPGLTEEQNAQIKKLHLENEKANLPIENNINELEAKLKTATTGDNTSFDLASKLVDEITALRGKLMKNNLKTRLDIRKLLTDEQKIVFDKHPMMDRMPRPGIHDKMEMKHPR